MVACLLLTLSSPSQRTGASGSSYKAAPCGAFLIVSWGLRRGGPRRGGCNRVTGNLARALRYGLISIGVTGKLGRELPGGLIRR